MVHISFPSCSGLFNNNNFMFLEIETNSSIFKRFCKCKKNLNVTHDCFLNYSVAASPSVHKDLVNH